MAYGYCYGLRLMVMFTVMTYLCLWLMNTFYGLWFWLWLWFCLLLKVYGFGLRVLGSCVRVGVRTWARIRVQVGYG